MESYIYSKNRERKLLKPKIDIVFQSLFSKENLEITKAFAEDILDEKIESIIINEDKNLLREKMDDKLGILDLELDVNDNKKVDVEIQLIDKKDFIKRLIWYFARLYGKQAKKGKNYNDIKKVVLVAIVDFEIKETKNFKEMETIWKLIETKKREKILTDEIELHIIEMRKAKEMYEKNKEDKKAQWIMFLNNPNSKEVESIVEDNKGVKEAVIKVMELSEDEKMERLAFLREKAIMDEKAIREGGYDDGYNEGRENGLKQGMKDGIKKGANDTLENIVKSMILNKIDDEQIKKITNIDDKELNKIKDIIYNEKE